MSMCQEVNKAGEGIWVVLHLYKQGYVIYVLYSVLYVLNKKNVNPDCSGGELSPQPHINNIGLCVHYMIYRIKLINIFVNSLIYTYFYCFVTTRALLCYGLYGILSKRNSCSRIWLVYFRIPLCELLNQHLTALARKFPETKFIKSISTTCIPNFPDAVSLSLLHISLSLSLGHSVSLSFSFSLLHSVSHSFTQSLSIFMFISLFLITIPFKKYFLLLPSHSARVHQLAHSFVTQLFYRTYLLSSCIKMVTWSLKWLELCSLEEWIALLMVGWCYDY